MALYLLGLLNYYSHDIKLRHIHLNLICYYFTSIIFYRLSIFELLEDNAIFTSFIQLPICMLGYYWYKGVYFSEFYLYIYFAIILIMKRTKSSKQVFEFKESYLYKLDLIQKHYIKLGSDFLVAWIDNLSQCQFEKNTISNDHPDIILWQNDLTKILLALFIL